MWFAILKTRMKKIPRRTFGINVIGVVGYMFALVSWTLLLAVFFVLLANSSFMTMPHQTVTPSLSLPAHASTGAMLISYGITALAIIVTLFVFITLPYFIGRNLSRLLRFLATAAKVSPTKWHMWLFKAFMTVIPCLGLSTITAFGIRGDDIVPIYTVVFFVSLLSFGIFSFQYLMAWRLDVPDKSIW